MKQFTLILAFVFVTLTGFSQKKDSVTTPPKEPTPTEKIISRTDLEAFIKYMRENMSVAQYESAKPPEIINLLWMWMIQEINKAKPIKK